MSRRPEREIQNEFRISLDGDECVGIANAVVVGLMRPFVSFFFPDESPNLVALYIGNFDVADVPAHDPLAVLARQLEHGEYGFRLNVAETAVDAHRIAFHQAMKDLVTVSFASRTSAPNGFSCGSRTVCRIAGTCTVGFDCGPYRLYCFDSATVARHANLL